MFSVGTNSRLLRLKVRSPSPRKASTFTTKPITNSPWTTAASTTTKMIQIGKRQRSNIIRTKNITHIKSSSFRTISISPRIVDSSSVPSSSCYICSSNITNACTSSYFNKLFARTFSTTTASAGGTSNHNKSRDGAGIPSRPPRSSSPRPPRSAPGTTTTTSSQRPRGITHRLLQTPLGSLSTPQFQQQTTNQIRFHISQNKKTGADQALLLVERLLREQLETEVPTLLDTEILMDVLKCCRRKSVDMKKLEVVADLLLAPPFFKSDERVSNDDDSSATIPKGGGFWSQKMLGILLGGITKCHGRNAPDRALALLDRITTCQQEIGEVVVTPNSFSYNAILAGYAKHGLVRRAEDLLLRMHHQDEDEGSKPDTVSYSCVMNAISRSNAADAPKRAKALLEQMLSSKVLPDVVTWNSLLNCYANRGMAKEAEEWLERMETLQKKALLTDGPNTISYNSVLNAWAKSDHADAPQRAKELLSHMVALQDDGSTTSKEEGQGQGGSDDKDNSTQHSKPNKKSGVQVEPNKITQTSFLLCFEKNDCMQEGYDEWERITHQTSSNIL